MWNERPLKLSMPSKRGSVGADSRPTAMIDEAAGQLAAVADLQPPQIARLVEARRLDLAVELHVLAQVELVGDVVEVAQVLRLAGEPFLPVPLVEQLLRERVAVGVALRVEAGAGVAVPVPGAAEVGARPRAPSRRCRGRPAA